jgi:molybdate transport system substrate-binding protein
MLGAFIESFIRRCPKLKNRFFKPDLPNLQVRPKICFENATRLTSKSSIRHVRNRFYEPSLLVTYKLHEFLMHYLHNVMRIRPSVNRRQLIKASAGLATLLSMASFAAPVKLRVAAASDLKFALTNLAKRFTAISGIEIDLQFGSSGNIAQQIQQGLPVDLFLSADESYVLTLAKTELTQGGVQDSGAQYATGRIALMLSKNSAFQLPKNEAEARLTLQNQLKSIRKFAIANPEHAPYGRAAKEALQNLGLWEQLQPKLVLGDNISQATQFVTSGAAQAGITALSLALAPEVSGQSGGYWLLPAGLHTPLKQRMVILKSAHPTARALFDYLQTPAAKAVLAKYGFST